MEIAANIQTSILPRDLAVPGLEISARMQPAEQVGGDYYDVLPVQGGCWLAIGDVAGHGVRAGLTMLQAQSALAALVRHDPQASPQALWATLNRTFFDNVRRRLRHNEHMTFSLIRYHDDGRLEIVGAHEEIVIWRAAKNEVEVLPVQGTWVGLAPEIRAIKDHRELRLDEGDVMVLYTDGIIEARDRAGLEVGLDAVCGAVRATHTGSVAEIRDAIFALSAGHPARDDDASVVVVRYRRPAKVAAA
jgi:sigma-B regulation protein RsbU (phosphoserine phosphatase)